MKKILFIHQNFPGQFYHISKYLTSKFVVHSMSFSNRKIDGITHHQCFYYSQNKLEKNNLSLEFETKSIRAKIVSDKCLELKKNDFYPDVPVQLNTIMSPPKVRILAVFQKFLPTKSCV